MRYLSVVREIPLLNESKNSSDLCRNEVWPVPLDWDLSFSWEIKKGIWLRHPRLSLFFQIDSILVDSQKEAIHRIANLFSQGKCPLHWIHPPLSAFYAVISNDLSSPSSESASFFLKSNASLSADWLRAVEDFSQSKKIQRLPRWSTSLTVVNYIRFPRIIQYTVGFPLRSVSSMVWCTPMWDTM